MLLALPPMTSLDTNPSHEVKATQMLISENEAHLNNNHTVSQVSIKKAVCGVDLESTPLSSVDDAPDSCKKDDTLPPTSSPLQNGHSSEDPIVIDHGDLKETDSLPNLDAETESSSCFSSSSDDSTDDDIKYQSTSNPFLIF
jgi:hypothetical protein